MLQNSLWLNIGFDLTLVASLVAAWYWLCLHLNRRRSAKILCWIDEALSVKGGVAGVEWQSASRFRVRLRLSETCFRHPSIIIKMAPRELPLHWILDRWRGRIETATFEANLPCPPAFSIDVQSQSWCGRIKSIRRAKKTAGFQRERLGPLVVTSRREWQSDVVRVMDSLSSPHECGFTTVAIHRSTPHFSATAPLEMLAPKPEAHAGFFDVVRELAAGASASSRF